LLKINHIEIVLQEKHLFTAQNIDLTGGLVALVGRNGSGKSSFLRAILNEQEGVLGEITLAGQNIKAYTKAELAKQIAVVYARNDIFGEYSAHDIIALGRIPYQNMFCQRTEADEIIINDVSQKMDISHLLGRSFNSLSDGERQMVMIARAFAQETKVILLDEPSAFLDVVNRKKLVELLANYAADKSRLILYSTHDIDLLDQFCDETLFLHNDTLQILSKETNFITQIKNTFQI
jgi:iron complex transport system ATP-binding protein